MTNEQHFKRIDDRFDKVFNKLDEIGQEQAQSREEINYILRETFGDSKGSGNWGFGQRIRNNTDQVRSLIDNKVEKKEFDEYKKGMYKQAGTMGGGIGLIVSAVVNFLKELFM